ncbi:MAG TPA: hypothetical protein VLA89_06950 [Gemmatimonadales bacterium]|nr:hypothetical protein [Gemmatimonadales bacterium]
MQGACLNCGTTQGPFERQVLSQTNKVKTSMVVCGFRRSETPTKEERQKRVRECNARRAAADAKRD